MEKRFRGPAARRSACWEVNAGQAEPLLELGPIERSTGVPLAAGGDVFVPSNKGNGIALGKRLAQPRERCILGGLEGFALQAFELYADRIVIASIAAAVV
jgi:hypothetical protein